MSMKPTEFVEKLTHMVGSMEKKNVVVIGLVVLFIVLAAIEMAVGT
jgi:hypothetical protein